MNKKFSSLITTVIFCTIFLFEYGSNQDIVHVNAQTMKSAVGTEAKINMDTNHMLAPTVAVNSSMYMVPYGGVLKSSDIDLTVTTLGSYKIVFTDGGAEKTFSDISMIGKTQELVVSVIDTTNGEATNIIITVIVEDKTAPVISGVKNLTTTKGKKINLFNGITAKDNIEGDLTSKVKTSKVDFNKVGVQEVTYTVTDKNGNTAKVTAKVTIKPASKVMFINTQLHKIYEACTFTSKELAEVYYKDKVTLLETIGESGWAKVKLSNGIIGYCGINQLQEEIFTTVNKPMYVNIKSLNIRKGYDIKYKMIRAIPYNTKVILVARVKYTSWVKVKLSDGTVGYCREEALNKTKSAKKNSSYEIGAKVDKDGQQYEVGKDGSISIIMTNPRDVPAPIYTDGGSGW